MMIHIDGEVYSSKNSRTTAANGRSFKSKGAKGNEKTFAHYLNLQRAEWERMTHGRPLPLVVVFRLRRKTRRAFDYNNLVQGVLDAMVKVGYLADDDMHHVIPIPAPWVHAPKDAGCDIWVADYSAYVQLIEMVKEAQP